MKNSLYGIPVYDEERCERVHKFLGEICGLCCENNNSTAEKSEKQTEKTNQRPELCGIKKVTSHECNFSEWTKHPPVERLWPQEDTKCQQSDTLGNIVNNTINKEQNLNNNRISHDLECNSMTNSPAHKKTKKRSDVAINIEKEHIVRFTNNTSGRLPNNNLKLENNQLYKLTEKLTTDYESEKEKSHHLLKEKENIVRKYLEIESKLKNCIEDLSKELTSTKIKLADVEVENKQQLDFQKLIAFQKETDLMTEINTLRLSTNKSIIDLQSKLEKAKTEAARFENRVRTLEKEKCQLADEMKTRLRDQKSSCEKTATHYKSEIESKHQNEEKLLKKIKDLEKSLSIKDKCIADLESSLKTSSKNQNDFERNMKRTRSESVILNQRLSETHEQANQSHQHLSLQLRNSESQMQEQSKLNQDLIKDVENLRKENKLLKEHIRNGTKNSNNETLVARNNELDEENKQLKGRFDSYYNKVQSQIIEIQKLREIITNLEQESKSIDNYKTCLRDYKVKLKNCCLENTQLKTEVNTLNIKLNEVIINNNKCHQDTNQHALAPHPQHVSSSASDYEEDALSSHRSIEEEITRVKFEEIALSSDLPEFQVQFNRKHNNVTEVSIKKQPK